MKKYFSLLIMFCLSLQLIGETKMTKNVTFTVGNTYTLDPVGDLGLPKTADYFDYSWQNANGNYLDNSGMYNLSNTNDISVIPEYHQTYNGGGPNPTIRGYYTYLLTPQVRGNYTFNQKVAWHHDKGYVETVYYEITYNISVVDVIAISMVQSLSLSVGAEERLTPTIVQVGAETTLTWLSSNTSVATVSEEGMIKAISAGTTTITCIAHNGVSAQCLVTVNSVQVSGVVLNLAEAELTIGEQLQLEASVSPENATNKNVTWSSTNEEVAMVTGSGKVYAIGKGFCMIKATSDEGSGKSASCLIMVYGLTSISIPNNLPLNVGETYTFTPIIMDNKATATLTWQSSNTTVATIDDNGTLTAKAEGNTIITCTAQNGVSAHCAVTVRRILATGISLNTTSAEIQIGETKQMTAIIFPSNVTNKSVTWSSSNSNIATVDRDGLVTAVKSGTCRIVATTADGSTLSAECLIHVLADSVDGGKQESMMIWRNGLYESFNINEVDSVSFSVSATTLVSDISLSQGTLRMKVGETKVLTATVYPDNASTRAVTWESDNKYVATVDQSGMVTAKSIGSCVITAQAKDGSGVKATCLLTVEMPDIIDDNIKYIGTGQELADFANMVNAGAYNINAILTNDINFTAYPDVMIGSENFAYRGDFDGAGHTITLDLHRSSDRAALFYMLEGRVHDLTTVGTITTSAKFAAGIAAITSNATIERCQSLVTIESSIEGDGTHGGIVGVSRDGTIISDCLISGSINGSQTNRCGGVSGWAEGKTDISNCLIRSTFAVDTFDSDLLARNSQNVTSSNNYFHGNWNAPNDCGNVTLLTDMQEKSGEACILLNAGRTGNETAWYQTLGMDNYPVPDKTHKIVVYDGTNGYHNSILAMRQLHPKSIYLPFAIDYNAIIGDFELVDTGEHSISFHK